MHSHITKCCFSLGVEAQHPPRLGVSRVPISDAFESFESPECFLGAFQLWVFVLARRKVLAKLDVRNDDLDWFKDSTHELLLRHLRQLSSIFQWLAKLVHG